jgi:hypothetical protein
MAQRPIGSKRGEIIWLGVAAGVSGCLVGGLLLFVGMTLVTGGQNVGWIFLLPAAPAGALPGWLMARRLAREIT